MAGLHKISKLLTTNSIKDVFQLAWSRLIKRRVDNYVYIESLFKNKSGIEIGGPSGDFRNHGFIPLYNVVKSLDGCNFSTTTIWEGNINNETSYLGNITPGLQHVSEATNLSFSPNEKYDFLISSNCLEHVANPLKAIEEWLRVIKKDGLLLLILPHKDYCFDHQRPITDMNHLRDDYNNNTDESDLTHLTEILQLHDLKMDKGAGSREQFEDRALKNQQNRALHHHVFDRSLLMEMCNFFNLEVLLTHDGRNGHIVLAKKI